MLHPFSQIERALRSTLIHKATGAAFDRLAAFYGLPRPGAFGVPAWRRALRAVAFGARGTPGCTQGAVEGAFWDSGASWSVTLDPATPSEVLLVSGDTAAFDCGHVGRLVRIDLIPASAVPFDDSLPSRLWPWVSRLFLTVEFVSSTRLGLAPVDTAMFNGARWDSGPLEIDPVYGAASMRILPFMYRERGSDEADDPWGLSCRYELLVDASLLAVPPTYLLDPAGVDRDTISPLMPDGGHILDPFDDSTPNEGNQTVGPHPIYLGDGGSTELAAIFDPLLAAGMRVEVLDLPACG